MDAQSGAMLYLYARTGKACDVAGTGEVPEYSSVGRVPLYQRTRFGKGGCVTVEGAVYTVEAAPSVDPHTGCHSVLMAPIKYVISGRPFSGPIADYRRELDALVKPSKPGEDASSAEVRCYHLAKAAYDVQAEDARRRHGLDK